MASQAISSEKSSGRTRASVCACVLLGLAFVGTVVRSQQPDAGTHPDGTAQEFARGQQIFAANCAACHGLDGSGTQRAPNIGAGSRIQRLSANDVLRIISDGVPGTGMPSFRILGDAKINALTAFVKTLNGDGHAAPLSGDPVRGKALFFGAAGCSTCHAIGGNGGFIAPDLSSYAQTHSADRIEAAIKDPAQRDAAVVLLNVTTADGHRYRGIVRNEDNFTIQLQSMDGSFQFFRKADLKRIEREPASLMPSDYGSNLTPLQLNDLISYLINASDNSRSAPVKNNEDEH